MTKLLSRRGMVLPLLLLVLLFGSLLAGLLLKEAQSVSELSTLVVEQATGSSAGVSAISRGEAWILEQLVRKEALPRWLDAKPSENGLLELDEWILLGRGNLLVKEEEFHQGELVCSLKIYDLDYRLADPLLGDSSLLPSYFDLFSLSGGSELVDTRAIGRLLGREDVSLSGGMSLEATAEELVFSEEGQAVLLFKEDAAGASLSCSNGEVSIRFRLSEGSGTFPKRLDLGFRLVDPGDQPSSAFGSGFSASFCVEDEACPENRDRLLLMRNAGGSGEEAILARIPFPYCRSANPFDQERYLAYLSRPHELRLRFEPEGVTAVLDPGEGTLEKPLSVRLECPLNPSLNPFYTGLRIHGQIGGSVSISSLRVHPADEKGYFHECRQRGYYLLEAVVTGPHLCQAFETIVSADLASKRLCRLAWSALPFF